MNNNRIKKNTKAKSPTLNINYNKSTQYALNVKETHKVASVAALFKI